MPRNILNQTGTTVYGTRNILNQMGNNTITAREPLELLATNSTSSIMTLKGLNGFTANKIVKVNSAGDALEYATETDTVYTLQSPLSFISGTKIQIQQSLFNVSTSLVDGDFIPIFDSNGNFDKISFLNLKTIINYQGTSPIVADNTNFVYDLDFSGLSDFGEGDIGDTAEFLLSTDGIKTFRALKFSKLKSQIPNTTSVVSPLALSGTQISINQALFNIQTILNDGDFCPYFDTAGNFDRITMSNMRNYMTTQAINFGTDGSTSGQRVFGNVGRDAEITGYVIQLTNGNETVELAGNGDFSYKTPTDTWFKVNDTDIFLSTQNLTVNATNSKFRAITLINEEAPNQWNVLQTYTKADKSDTTAYSIRVYDFQPTGTNYQYYGIFSNNNVGDNASPTCPFQIRNDGYIELKSNFTNNITSLSNLGVTGITTQLKYVARTTYNSYHPMQQMGLASGGAWTRWNYSHTSGTDYGGISYSSGSSGTDCITWQNNGNFYITGIYSPSDKRIKTNIVDADLDECITVMKSIKLKKYKYTDAYQETYKTTKEEVYGFLADDIIDNEYLNYAGSDDGLPKDLKDGTQLENFRTIDKPKILTVLWGVCNKQQTEIELLKSEIANIKSVLNIN